MGGQLFPYFPSGCFSQLSPWDNRLITSQRSSKRPEHGAVYHFPYIHTDCHTDDRSYLVYAFANRVDGYCIMYHRFTGITYRRKFIPA
jgi:hypothetical protein